MKHVLPALPRPPLKAFFVQVKGTPGPDLVFESDFPVTGFYRLLGLTVGDKQELVSLAREVLQHDGSTFADIEDVWIPDFAGKDADLADVVGDLRTLGVWYKSGHAYFGSDDDDE